VHVCVCVCVPLTQPVCISCVYLLITVTCCLVAFDIHTHAHTHTSSYRHMLTHTHTHIHAHTHSYTHAHTFTRSHTCSYTHTLLHTCSHTLIHTEPGLRCLCTWLLCLQSSLFVLISMGGACLPLVGKWVICDIHGYKNEIDTTCPSLQRRTSRFRDRCPAGSDTPGRHSRSAPSGPSFSRVV